MPVFLPWGLRPRLHYAAASRLNAARLRAAGLPRAEVGERHLEPPTHAGVHVMHHAGESVGRQPPAEELQKYRQEAEQVLSGN
jgi:hypothetical protein